MSTDQFFFASIAPATSALIPLPIIIASNSLDMYLLLRVPLPLIKRVNV